MKTLRVCAGVLAALALPLTAQAVTLGQLDDFQAGVAGWTEGAASPNQPFQLLDGGPGGVGDHALRNESSGVAGSGGKMVMFNNGQWTGDYMAAGVTAIEGWMRVDPSSAASSLLMRVAIQGDLNQQYASTTAIEIPNDGVWYAVSFGLSAGDLTQVAGTDTLNTVLSNVSELRILHSTAPAWRGGNIPATLDVDNLTAVPEPSALGLMVLAGGLALRRRR